MASILVLNGPNLNLLGSREPDKYGHRSLQEIMEELDRFAGACGHQLRHAQENSEGVLIDAIHKAAFDGIDYIIFNPAGYTHTSVALRDALLARRIPFIVVHLSASAAREPFRQFLSRPGDELALAFDASRLPGQAPGMSHITYLLFAHGYTKEMDLSSSSPDQVAPLPFRGMSSYPYDALEHYPDTAAHRAYLHRYNTRVIGRMMPALEAQLPQSRAFAVPPGK